MIKEISTGASFTLRALLILFLVLPANPLFSKEADISQSSSENCIQLLIKKNLKSELATGKYSWLAKWRQKKLAKQIEFAIRKRCPQPDSCSDEEILAITQKELNHFGAVWQGTIYRAKRALGTVIVASFIIGGVNQGLTLIFHPYVASSISFFLGMTTAGPVQAIMASTLDVARSKLIRRSYEDEHSTSGMKDIDDFYRGKLQTIFFRGSARLEPNESSGRSVLVNDLLLANGPLATAKQSLMDYIVKRDSLSEDHRKMFLEAVAADLSIMALFARTLFLEIHQVDKSFAINVSKRLGPAYRRLSKEDREYLEHEFWALIAGNGDARHHEPADPLIEAEGVNPSPVRDYYRMLMHWMHNGEIVYTQEDGLPKPPVDDDDNNDEDDEDDSQTDLNQNLGE